MKRVGLIAALLLAGLVVPAWADDDSWVDTDEDGFAVGVDQVHPGNHQPGPGNAAAQPIGTYHQEPACTNVCSGARTCPDGTVMMHSWVETPDGSRIGDSYWCPSDGGPAVTDDLVATAFRRIPLPPSTFTIQPPGGRTLVNFETNFFTDQDGTLERSVRLLGQRVDLRIEADSYTWRFGDGESITTSGPGAPYPKLLVTHNYRTKGEYGPALDITWVADYRVGGGAWQPVPGSVTISGSPAELRAIEARPTLVGYGG